MRRTCTMVTMVVPLLLTTLLSGCGAGGEDGEAIAQQMKTETNAFAERALPKFASAVDGGYQDSGRVGGDFSEGDGIEGSPTFYEVSGTLRSRLAPEKARERLQQAMRDLGLKVTSEGGDAQGSRPNLRVEFTIGTYGQPGSAAVMNIRSDEHKLSESIRYKLAMEPEKTYGGLPTYP